MHPILKIIFGIVIFNTIMGAINVFFIDNIEIKNILNVIMFVLIGIELILCSICWHSPIGEKIK